MENPKIRIESDGIHTEVYVDGEKVDKIVSLNFHHDTISDESTPKCRIIYNRTHESGALMVGNNKILREVLDIL